MTRAVLPKATAKQNFLLTGQVDRDAGKDERAPPVDDDDDDDEGEGEDAEMP